MTTNKAAVVVSEEQVERMAKWLCRHDIAVSKDLDEVMRQMEKWPRYKDEAREALNYTLQAALGVGGWRPIAEAPAETSVWVFDPTQEPQQFVATLTEGYDGPYWKPAEELVAEVLDEYLSPTNFRDLPPPPASEEG